MIKNVISFRLSNYLDRYITEKLQVTPVLKQRLIDVCNSDILEKDNKLLIIKKLSQDSRFKEVILKSSNSMINN